MNQLKSAASQSEREWPQCVKRYLTALGGPAQMRWKSSAAHRDLAFERSLAVVTDPWGTSLDQVKDTKEFSFLRDFFNVFHECINSCQSLDLIRDLSVVSLNNIEKTKLSSSITYWSENHLNEVYIFQLRLLDFIKFVQRRYKKDIDFTEFVTQVGDSLAIFVKENLDLVIADRSLHVHERRHRHADPELARLFLLDVLIDVLQRDDLRDNRDAATDAARAWLDKQVAHHSDLAWHLLNEVCSGFADGILLENNRMIVPRHYKDNPNEL